ncbi:MAG: hypothetical protein PHE54_04175 [Bacilli bacterium]|nr:hypothetical protein [Bacilli bacterium]
MNVFDSSNIDIVRKDCYVCHLTCKSKMQGIIEKELVPMLGDNCKRVDDTRKAIFAFYLRLDNLIYHRECIYNGVNINDLILLRLI